MSFNQSRFKPMKRWVVVFSFMSMLCTGALSYAKGPEVDLVDNKLSISAEAITLSRLLQLVDLATGMKSKVPPELANRVISVRFSDLPVSDAIRKIFQGQPLDYALIAGQGVVVTGTSQSSPAGNESFPPSPINSVQSNEQPFFQEFPGNQQQLQMEAVRMQQQQEALRMQQLQQQQQPATVQTPFGPIANPRALPPQNQQQPPVSAQQN